MRLLLLNPNTSSSLTERLAGAARAVLSPGTVLEPVTAPSGFPYISSRAEAQIAGAAALATLADREGSFDAAVIAAFGDPGLAAARELFDRPITGMSEASMLAACSLGRRFAFVTFAPQLIPWYTTQVDAAGLAARFAGAFTPDEAFTDIASVAEDLREPLIATCRKAAREADVLILAGAPIAGLTPSIRDDVPALLLDPLQAAVLAAEQQFRLFPNGADRGSFQRPPGKSGTGLPAPLAAWMSRPRSA